MLTAQPSWRAWLALYTRIDPDSEEPKGSHGGREGRRRSAAAAAQDWARPFGAFRWDLQEERAAGCIACFGVSEDWGLFQAVEPPRRRSRQAPRGGGGGGEGTEVTGRNMMGYGGQGQAWRSIKWGSASVGRLGGGAGVRDRGKMIPDWGQAGNRGSGYKNE